MKHCVLILAVAATALAGCASSNMQSQPGQTINEPAGAAISTNSIDSQMRDVNQQPIQHSWTSPAQPN